jgi:hypothetical protein
MKKIGVIYYWQPHNKINGSLFYAYEYFVELKQLNKDTDFIIVGKVSDSDYRLINKAFSLKYKEDIYPKFHPIFLDSILKLSGLKLERTLFVDMKSYNKCHFLVDKDNCHLYCNNKDHIDPGVSQPKYIYGYYHYQFFNIMVPLKLKFDIFKDIPYDSLIEKHNTWFISSPNINLNEISDHIPNDYDFKQPNKYLNIFEEYNKILYIHNGILDTNNRLIPEAFFYDKILKVKFIKEEYKMDSIAERYFNIAKRGLLPYTLDQYDIIIRNILKDIDDK